MIKQYITLVMVGLCSMVSVGVSFATNNPVVQIVGYDAVGGRYPNMLGWGSASIITKDGLILTNNHVVDNGRGGTLAGFSICITVNDTQRPSCHYTASLIARDIRRDVALLRIDPVDIFGKPVRFDDMTTIELDYAYVPKAQDTVVAIGYPWVGANTITKTQGVIAGVQPYNDVTYLKTDALIAGGNSGGPLVLNGKVVGVNTFGIGGGIDTSLGYALSIAEVKDFISTNATKSGSAVSPKIAFSDYLRTLETININKSVRDDFVQMKFDTSYKVTHYIPNLQLRGEISNPDIYHVQQFNIQRINLPTFKDKKEQEYFLKHQMQIYGSSWKSDKLKIKKIGGLDFYEPIDTDDPSGGEGYGYKKYFTVSKGTMIIITLNTPLGDENTQEQVKANIDSFLSNIVFGSIDSLSPQVFELYSPAIVLPNSGQVLVDVFGQMNRGFTEQYGWRSSYVKYLGNLYEIMGLFVEANSLSEGKGKTAQELLDAATANSYGAGVAVKGLVNFYGNEGYMVCGDDEWNDAVDAQGRVHQMASCVMRIIAGSQKEHMITFYISVEKDTLEARKKELFAFVDAVMKPLGLGTTTVFIDESLRPDAHKIKFHDIADQDPALQRFLSKLVSWKVLKDKPQFNGDYVLQWQDYIPLYLKMVYNKNLTDMWSATQTYGDIIATLPYSPTAFVPLDQAKNSSAFELMLKIKLAGVTYSDFSEYGLNRFERLKDTLYKDQWNQIQAWEYSIYGQRMIRVEEAFGGIGEWYSDYTMIYNPITMNLSKNALHSPQNIHLDSGISPELLQNAKDEWLCYENNHSIVSSQCLQRWQSRIARYVSYPVLTKGDAINELMGSVDVGLFDVMWAKKKETQIEL